MELDRGSTSSCRSAGLRDVPQKGVLLVSLQGDVYDWPAARLTSDGPEFLSPIHNLTVNVGREAVLSCSVANLGRYKVAWVRAEDQTVLSLNSKVVTHNSRISVSHDSQHTWQLRIRQLKESDRGCYMCQINTSVLKTQEGCIDVNVPPDIVNDDTSGDLSVLEGENTTLWCKAVGHPSPRIAWRREDGHPITIRKGHKEIMEVDIYNGSNLHFWRLDRKQMGAYLCIASNDVPPAVSKRIALSVNFAPVIKVPNQLLGAPLNTDVQLECYVEAFPNTINYWLKNRGEMLLNGTRYTIREQRKGYRVYMSLIVRSFSTKDVGTYNCVSTNSLGRAEGTLRLYEIKVSHAGTHEYVNGVGGVAESARSHISRETNGKSSSLCVQQAHFLITIACIIINPR
ncbi:hypothetical protein RI129_012710 [Pyrocoelia pectoralis]|uniref:Ig-like domain-containing protein n=2 Tax=Lampyrinae TaxID=433514 RepID=A0AAN7UU41_9COLE